MGIKFLDDHEINVSGGVTLEIIRASDETNVTTVAAPGATLELFGAVLPRIDPYGASNGRLINGDEANAPGVKFNPVSPLP